MDISGIGNEFASEEDLSDGELVDDEDANNNATVSINGCVVIQKMPAVHQVQVTKGNIINRPKMTSYHILRMQAQKQDRNSGRKMKISTELLI